MRPWLQGWRTSWRKVSFGELSEVDRGIGFSGRCKVNELEKKGGNMEGFMWWFGLHRPLSNSHSISRNGSSEPHSGWIK